MLVTADADRIAALVAQMSPPEKVSQLLHASPAIPRLGIPAYNWWNEACHGVARNGRATVFPQAIGLAATWNGKLLERIGEVIAAEARAKHAVTVAGVADPGTGEKSGEAAASTGQYQGLTFWTPCVNLLRDPRWGRSQETLGEDPFLTGELGLAMVRGLQGPDPSRLRVAACAKALAAHSGPESQRHSFDVHPPAKDLWESYLPAFEKLVRGGVEAVMGAYSRLNGEPCCGSRWLLTEVLREKWGFAGHVVSDCGAIDDFHRGHGVTRNPIESAALALAAGCDLNCGCSYGDLVRALAEGRVTTAQVDQALTRVLSTRFRLGLFDRDERRHSTAAGPDATGAPPPPVVDGAEHRRLARQAAVESMVLLKNNGALPLPVAPGRVLVVGPNAATTSVLLGNYHGLSGRLVTLIEGVTERLEDRVALEYRMACPLLSGGDSPENYAFVAAGESDVVIAVMGLDPSIEGEEGDAATSLAGGDRAALELPANQRNFLRLLRPHARKLILVLTGGSALAVPEEHGFCDAVLQVWYPGCEGGTAVADVLFGDAAPSGRLPLTVPRSTADLPPFADYAMRGRTYRFAEVEPLYPFGFGLTYGRVRYVSIEVSASQLGAADCLEASVVVQGDADRDVEETVQLYVGPAEGWPDAPKATLIAFRKAKVRAGRQEQVEFAVRATELRVYDAKGTRVWVPGSRRLIAGPAAPGARAVELGAPASVEREIVLR